MIFRIYLRVAKGDGKYLVNASTTPKFEPLYKGTYAKKAYPTVTLALDLDIPDSEFEATRILLQQKIQATVPAVNVTQENVELADDTPRNNF
jgi:hypothetical protein